MRFIYNFLVLGLATSQALAQGPPGGGQFGGGGQQGGPHNGGGGPPAPTGPWQGAGQTAGSPAYNYIFQKPLHIPPTAKPGFSENIDGRIVDYYSMTIESFQAQIYPNLGPANLVGYNGMAPGPLYIVERGHETIIRCLNKGSQSSAVHLHGSATHATWDGWASDEMQVGQWKDYYYPNYESGRSMWYHDHADGHTSVNAYFGQAGAYIIHDPAEDSLGLPSGKYDVPLAITDKIYQSNGDLVSPASETINFFGDTIHVNGQPWPYLSVEPRKYRFRIYDMSLSRPYDLYFEDANANMVNFQVIASDCGLFGSPVAVTDVVIAMGERYEVVVDFAAYAGQNITLKNSMQVPQIDEFENTDKVMMFAVGKTVSDSSNNGAVPSTLNGDIPWPTQRTTVDHTFEFQMGGDAQWTINGIAFSDINNRILAKPPQGATELWELRHAGGPAVHPVHIHMVNLQVVSRTGGSRGVLPYESAGMKDTVLLEPGEVVHVLAAYAPWDGLYMFHCHNLIHEDHAMMAVMNVTLLESLGYDFNTTTGYADPDDASFVAQDYSDEAFAPAAVSSAVLSLASLNPYQSVSSLLAAESAYYATAPFNGETTAAATATTAPATTGRGAPTTSPGRPTTTSGPPAGRPAHGPPRRRRSIPHRI